MHLQTKVQIARSSLTLLFVIAALFLLGVLVLVLCVGLGINPFRETTTEFLGSAFVGLIGTAVVLVLLNLATNISLIADSKIVELKIEPRPGVLKKWVIVFAGIALALVGLVFAGTYFSKQKYLRVVHSQASEVINTNKTLLDEVSRRLASGEYDDYKRISEIRTFLQDQRSGMPGLTLIYSGMFNGKMALYRTPEYFINDPQYKTYTPAYFPCTQSLDCEYLRSFFSGSEVHDLQKYTLRDDQFYVYVPFVGEKARFVLLFSRTNSYGKIGS